MGSKRWMLKNGLGELIRSRVTKYERFVDLFCGSAAVSWHVATKYTIPVHASDLQEFCQVLAAAVVCRTQTLGERWIANWFTRAASCVANHRCYAQALKLHDSSSFLQIEDYTDSARSMCAAANTPLTMAYGGYYFSPLQAIQIDALRSSISSREPYKTVGLAALINAASECCAAPGHTAQPFRPTESAEPYLRQAWSKNLLSKVRTHALTVSGVFSKVRGASSTCDANILAGSLSESDLVFIDPPYSSVHYSRFYHVLETISRGSEVHVGGAGRYPPLESRPRSRYSLPSEAGTAIGELLEKVGTRGAGAIVTFPARKASNGVIGEKVADIAETWFRVESSKVSGRFSTLGGNSRNRSARVRSDELLLSLTPR